MLLLLGRLTLCFDNWGTWSSHRCSVYKYMHTLTANYALFYNHWKVAFDSGNDSPTALLFSLITLLVNCGLTCSYQLVLGVDKKYENEEFWSTVLISGTALFESDFTSLGNLILIIGVLAALKGLHHTPTSVLLHTALPLLWTTFKLHIHIQLDKPKLGNDHG